jgi:hypothetical protein
MSEIFAMQRANGDWFALDHHGRLRVPLFHSSEDAMIARLRNFGLLLNARFLKEIAPLPGEDEVDFCMVEDPFASLNRGSTMGRTQLALLIHRPFVKATARQPRSGRMKEAHTQSVREVARMSEQVWLRTGEIKEHL